MTRRASGHALIIAIVAVAVVAILGVLGWLFWQNFINKSSGSTVTTYEQCQSTAGSKTLETYPEQCVTADGRTFTGPITQTVAVKDETYCAEAEELCFEYPSDWTIEKLTVEMDEPGAKADLIHVIAPQKELTLTLVSGIGGLGGTCEDGYKVDVTVREATPAASMSGYKDEYSVDMLQVARVVYPLEGKFVAAVYITDSAEYTTAGNIKACGIGFSQYINGRNARLSADSDSAGAFSFGYNGHTDGAQYGSRDDAEDAFDNEIYTQAAAILASLHYQ